MLKFGTVAEVTNMHDTARCRYTIQLARAVANLQPMLLALADVTSVEVERERITLEYLNDRDAAAVLLEKLVMMKLPIAGFNANAADLEEAYLRVGIEQVD
jgi:hypothetical protein